MAAGFPDGDGHTAPIGSGDTRAEASGSTISTGEFTNDNSLDVPADPAPTGSFEDGYDHTMFGGGLREADSGRSGTIGRGPLGPTCAPSRDGMAGTKPTSTLPTEHDTY